MKEKHEINNMGHWAGSDKGSSQCQDEEEDRVESDAINFNSRTLQMKTMMSKQSHHQDYNIPYEFMLSQQASRANLNDEDLNP